MTSHWIVVGGGSAGCVAAARLSAVGSRHVTLLEAGPDLAVGDVPAAIDGTDFFAAVGEPGRVHDGLLATRTTGGVARPYPTGRGLGGSSTVNAMIAMRGSTERYRSWGWNDTDEMWDRVAIPVAPPEDDELGAVDRGLLAADPHAERAPLTRRDGRRVTSAEAYLWPARDRQNLEIRPGARAAGVVLDQRRAVGVVLDDGTEVSADRVIVAAGAINSPALLLRSGVDTPGVGRGLQDHPSAALTIELRDPQYSGGLVTGALADHDGVQVLAMNHLGPAPDVAGMGMLMVAVMAPHGRAGTVTIDPGSGEPLVDVALLEDRRDLDALVGGVRHALELLRAPSFAELVAEIYLDDHGTTRAELSDDASIASWVRAAGGGYVHASSTCAMGTVVDAEGAVAGYDGLYVCDASVFPAIPDANTHLPTTMLAERLCARWV